MYKVFFNDRKLFLTDNFTRHFQVKYGLFYKYRDVEDLKELIDLYSKLTKINSLYLFHHDIDELRESFQKCFLTILAGGGLVKNDKGEFLLIFRRGKWDLPKGKLFKDESFEQGALREVKEECALNKLVVERPLMSTYHTYNTEDGIVLKKTLWFEMSFHGNETPKPQLEEQITDIKWVDPSDLEHYLKQSFPAIGDVFTYYGV